MVSTGARPRYGTSDGGFCCSETRDRSPGGRLAPWLPTDQLADGAASARSTADDLAFAGQLFNRIAPPSNAMSAERAGRFFPSAAAGWR